MWDRMDRDDVEISAGVGEVVGFKCSRCGARLDSIEVTTFGEKERHFIPAFECDCPA